MAFNNEIEKVKAEIKMLEKNLSFLEELQKTKSPVEEAYKDWWGQYPELETDSQYDDIRWQGFQAGYEFAYAISTAKEVMEKVQEEQEEDEWKSVALRFGEKLSGYLSDGYYELSPNAWFRWAVFTYGKGQQIKNAARESVKWYEEHQNESLEDYLKPHTPEQTEKLQEKNWYVDAKTLLKSNWEPKPHTSEETEQSLKEAFREAIKQGIIPEVNKPTDELIEKLIKNPPKFLKFELGQSLTNLIYDWWEDVFTTNSNDDMETSIKDLVDRIDKWLPKSQSAAGSQSLGVEDMVEGFNDYLKKIKSKMR